MILQAADLRDLLARRCRREPLRMSAACCFSPSASTFAAWRRARNHAHALGAPAGFGDVACREVELCPRPVDRIVDSRPEGISAMHDDVLELRAASAGGRRDQAHRQLHLGHRAKAV